MHDDVDLVGQQNVGDQFLVSDVALVENRGRRDSPAVTARKIVDDHDLLAAIDEGPDHVTSDVACAACDQNSHDFLPCFF